MIVPYLKIKELLTVNLLKTEMAKFHYGNEYELHEVLSVLKGNDTFPLVWYELPNTFEKPRLKDHVEGEHNMFYATRSKKEWFNDNREIETYQKVLYPLADKIEKCFERSDVFHVLSGFEYKPLHNYHLSETESKKSKNITGVNDYWDVLKVKFRARVNNYCFNTIKI